MTKTLRQLNISTWDNHSGESHDSRVRNAISHLSYIFSTVQARGCHLVTPTKPDHLQKAEKISECVIPLKS